MHLRLVIFVLSFWTLSAYPIYHDNSSREAAWTDPKTNYAYDKTETAKDIDKAYKSHVDNTDLYYGQEDDHSQNTMIEEMRHKLNMESERLRARLRQELAELRERLSPYPSNPSAALVRERLAPLTWQLQSSASSSSRDLCGQLSLYLRGLEVAEAQAEANPALFKEAFHLMSQMLDHSGAKMADILSDFNGKTSEVIDQLSGGNASGGDEAQSGPGHELRTRLGKEVSSLRLEAQSRLGALKTELRALLMTAQPVKADVTASIDVFCQSVALQNQVLQARIQRLYLGIENEMELHEAPSLLSSSSHQPTGVLHEDYSAKLSALIQDILHSVQ